MSANRGDNQFVPLSDEIRLSRLPIWIAKKAKKVVGAPKRSELLSAAVVPEQRN